MPINSPRQPPGFEGASDRLLTEFSNEFLEGDGFEFTDDFSPGSGYAIPQNRLALGRGWHETSFGTENNLEFEGVSARTVPRGNRWGTAQRSVPPLFAQESDPPAQTLYVRIPLGSEKQAKPLTGIYVPPNFQPSAKIDLIIYLHGIKPFANLSIDRYWNRKYFPYWPLREGLKNSQKNAILVAPTLGPRSQRETGWLTDSGGLDKYLDMVRTALAYGPYQQASPPLVGNIILACHSGGGLPMRTLALGRNRCASQIKECWGFDCLYFGGDETLWAQWAKARPDAKLYIHYQGSTRARSEKLKQKGIPNIFVSRSNAKSHNWVPIQHWGERLKSAPLLNSNRISSLREEWEATATPASRLNFEFTAQPSNSGTSASALPVALFVPKPADPLVKDSKMQTALTEAIASFERARRLDPFTFPIAITLVDITDASPFFPSAGHLETETHYIASSAKVSVMYSAYALRDMVRRLAGSSPGNALSLPTRLIKEMNPSIIKTFRDMARSPLGDRYLVPSYQDVFEVKPAADGGLRVDVSFTRAFDRALEGMIVPGHNSDATRCVHGIGYGYLNGALAAGGFFDPSTREGLWMAGDYQGGKQWPYERILTRNDGFVAQAGTTRDMAKLVSLIMTNRLLDSASCAEMRNRLAHAASIGGLVPWVAKTEVFRRGTITHNKVGFGPLKSGGYVWSEIGVYQSPVTEGRLYVIAWQNLAGYLAYRPISFTDVAKIIRATITDFER